MRSGSAYRANTVSPHVGQGKKRRAMLRFVRAQSLEACRHIGVPEGYLADKAHAAERKVAT